MSEKGHVTSVKPSGNLSNEQQHDSNPKVIEMTEAISRDLAGFHKELNGLWKQVAHQKYGFDNLIKPLVEAIFGPHPAFPPHSEEEKKKRIRRFYDSDAFILTRQLQDELGKLEGQVLQWAQKINEYQQKLMKDNPGKILDKPLNDHFNDLRRKVYLVVSLVSDVFDDDPPDTCPFC
jgi:hypothetical protein